MCVCVCVRVRVQKPRREPHLKDGEEKTHKGDASRENSFFHRFPLRIVSAREVCLQALLFLGQIIVEAKLQTPGFSEAPSVLGGRDTNGI